MFAVIYRGYIHPGHENEYKKLWKQVATYFIKNRGAIGSRLHKTTEGEYLAYSMWPDKKTRDASWGEHADINSLPKEIIEVTEKLKLCIDKNRPYDEICMNVVEDLLMKR